MFTKQKRNIGQMGEVLANLEEAEFEAQAERKAWGMQASACLWIPLAGVSTPTGLWWGKKWCIYVLMKQKKMQPSFLEGAEVK